MNEKEHEALGEAEAPPSYNAAVHNPYPQQPYQGQPYPSPAIINPSNNYHYPQSNYPGQYPPPPANGDGSYPPPPTNGGGSYLSMNYPPPPAGQNQVVSQNQTTVVTVVGGGGGGGAFTARAPDNTIFAWFTCLFCFWPLGLVAVMKARQAQEATQQNDFARAFQLSSESRRYSWIAFVLGFVVVPFILGLIIATI